MIRVVDLHKTFGGQAVLKGIKLELETGKVTTIIGGSGSGKTVLLKHLNALLAARIAAACWWMEKTLPSWASASLMKSDKNSASSFKAPPCSTP